MSASRQEEPILRDPTLDRTLARDGYVLVDLLRDDEVAQLRAEWSRHIATHPPVWDPTGLAASIRHPEQAWAAHRAIHRVVAEPIAALTVDRQCFMSTYLTKRAGSERLPEHLDWRLVAEPEELTHGCWIALSEISADDGALGVLPGSHRLVDFDRTPEDPGHDWCNELVGNSAPSALIEMSAGQAVLFDHRVVHFSNANDGTQLRGAANLGLCRPGSDEGCATRLLEMMDRGMRGIGSDPQIPR